MCEARVAALYDVLLHLWPTPVVALNRAVAVGMARGPQAGLELADALVVELEQRRSEATGSAVAAFANLCHKVCWAAEVLRVRP